MAILTGLQGLFGAVSNEIRRQVCSSLKRICRSFCILYKDPYLADRTQGCYNETKTAVSKNARQDAAAKNGGDEQKACGAGGIRKQELL